MAARLDTRLAHAAKLAKVPERTLRDWVYEGRLTYAKRGRVIYVSQAEVAELVEMRHAATDELAERRNRRYAVLHSVNYSPETQAPLSIRPR